MKSTLYKGKLLIYGKGIEQLEKIRLRMLYSKYRRHTLREKMLEPILPKRVPSEFYGLQKNKHFFLPYERIDNYNKVTAQLILEKNDNRGYDMSYTGTGISFRLNDDMTWRISMMTDAEKDEAVNDLIAD